MPCTFTIRGALVVGWLVTGAGCAGDGSAGGSSDNGASEGTLDSPTEQTGAATSAGPTTGVTASGTGPVGTATTDSGADSTDDGGADATTDTGDPPPAEFFHTCGEGGPTGDWAIHEVGYPAGTTTADGTPVTTARYEVWAPPPGETPYPLIVALHGDNGHPGRTKSDWSHLLDAHEFILVTPQEPHQEVDGGLAGNGWDNYPNQTREFLYNVLDDVGARYDVDIDRVYATGASAGSWVGGQIFFTMQQTFAAVQLSCGGATGVGYTKPPEPACKTPARFEIAPSDFLYNAAQTTAQFLTKRDHEVEFHDTRCEGHCCGQKEDYGDAAWGFFAPRTYCGQLSEPGCGVIGGPPR